MSMGAPSAANAGEEDAADAIKWGGAAAGARAASREPRREGGELPAAAAAEIEGEARRFLSQNKKQ
jgi:hypothetical protein